MRIILSILLVISSLFSNGQVIKASVNYKPFVPASSCPTVLSFSSLTNWTQSPAGTWIAVTGNAGEGMGSVSLSGNGWIQAEYDGTINTYNTAIFLTANEIPGDPGWYQYVEFGLYISDGSYSTAINGVYSDLAVSAVSGDIFRVWRNGTTVKSQYYRSGSWTDLFTYTTSSTGTLFMGGSSADPGWAVKLVNPKYCNE